MCVVPLCFPPRVLPPPLRHSALRGSRGVAWRGIRREGRCVVAGLRVVRDAAVESSIPGFIGGGECVLVPLWLCVRLVLALASSLPLPSSHHHRPPPPPSQELKRRILNDDPPPLPSLYSDWLRSLTHRLLVGCVCRRCCCGDGGVGCVDSLLDSTSPAHPIMLAACMCLFPLSRRTPLPARQRLISCVTSACVRVS